jgi:hypothetical protein
MVFIDRYLIYISGIIVHYVILRDWEMYVIEYIMLLYDKNISITRRRSTGLPYQRMKEPINVWWDNDYTRFVLDQHA